MAQLSNSEDRKVVAQATPTGALPDSTVYTAVQYQPASEGRTGRSCTMRLTAARRILPLARRSRRRAGSALYMIGPIDETLLAKARD